MTLDQTGTLEAWIAGPVVIFAGLFISWKMLQAARGKHVRTIFD